MANRAIQKGRELEERYRSIVNQAKQKFELIQTLVGRWNSEDNPKYRLSDDELRLYLNNEWICKNIIMHSPYSFIHSSRDPSGDENQRRRVIQRFSEDGDDLCKAVERFLDTFKVNEMDVLLYNSEIPKRMLRRKMTEQEYEGYLNGTLPISTTRREKYFLPKD